MFSMVIVLFLVAAAISLFFGRLAEILTRRIGTVGTTTHGQRRVVAASPRRHGQKAYRGRRALSERQPSLVPVFRLRLGQLVGL